MSVIQDATQAEVYALNKALITAQLAVQPFAQGDPCSDDVGDGCDTAVESALAAAGNAGYSATLPATEVVVSNGQTVVVHKSDGTVVAGTHVAEVAAGALTDVKLAATVAAVVAGVQTGVTVTGTYTSTVSFTVSAGKVTAIALS